MEYLDVKVNALIPWEFWPLCFLIRVGTVELTKYSLHHQVGIFTSYGPLKIRFYLFSPSIGKWIV